MGIKGLSKHLRKSFSACDISKFKDKRVGVDASSWVYQAYFSQLEPSGDESILVIRSFELKLKLFESNNIKVESKGGVRVRRPQTRLQKTNE
jgi:hypothetical protein